MTEYQSKVVCVHGPCTCMVDEKGNHCSDACADHDGEGCECGHQVCESFASRHVDADTFDPHTVAESTRASGATVDARDE